VFDIVDYPAIGAGVYFVKVRRRTGLPFGSGCESAPRRIDILDKSQDPDLDFTQLVPNSSCDPTNPNGEIVATAFERDLSVDAYTFSWSFNGGALPGIIPNDATPVTQLALAPEGNYELNVTNTITGCVFNKGITLDLNQSMSLPNIVNIAATNPVDCFPTGSAQVVQITIGGILTLNNPPDDIDTGFSYEWKKGASPAIVGTSSTLLSQLPDQYFVTVENLSTSCISSVVEIVIDSADIIYPDVKLRQTSPQVICDVATLGGSGSLVATVDLAKPVNSRNNLANYEIFWYANLDTAGAQINALSDSLIVNQTAGDYSVKVLDQTTNCRTKAIFLIGNDTIEFKPNLALTSGPLIECDSIDGSVLARGIHFENFSSTPITERYPFAYNYQAEFYTGSPADLNNPGPDLPNVPVVVGPRSENFLQPNLSSGLYTVRMNDLNTGCFTIDTISVRNNQVFPKPAIITIAPVTNCDPTRPNGVARALVNGSFIGYRFEWFEGTTPVGTPVYTGAEFGELKVEPAIYIVRATDLITGCSDNAQTSVIDGTVAIRLPEIEVLSHVTSCVINNGALLASVDGNTFDYIFNWYDGTEEVPPADFTGELYDSLAASEYSVTATSKNTGCTSPLVIGTIRSEPEFPDIDFSIEKALCGLSNGSASVTIISDVAIKSIEWTDPNGTITLGPGLSQIPSGTYSVLVTTILGCTAEESVEITTEIRPFNGISRYDTPGQNDYFHIDCIERFPENTVKIFNRAGTLVYEGHGYDNVETYFDGKSNKGISPMGINLPDGTYFFIVDKRDGSKAIEGYLEIVK
jgi:hypothetical protein